MWQARQIAQPAQHAIGDMARRAQHAAHSMSADVRSGSLQLSSLARLQVVAQDQHVGSHLFAGCALLGQLVLGIVWAGLMVSALCANANQLIWPA